MPYSVIKRVEKRKLKIFALLKLMELQEHRLMTLSPIVL